LLRYQAVSGFITEKQFAEAEKAFPGIARVYELLVRKPKTFLELVWEYQKSLLSCRPA
jgi:hypothetical protein